MSGRIDLGLSHAPLTTVATTPRATDPSSGDQFRAALGRGATTVLAGLERALPFAPGGVSTPLAVRSAPEAGPTASTSAGTGASASSVVGDNGNQAFELLALQERIGIEQQQFTTASNVMKARHDTAKNLIGNVR